MTTEEEVVYATAGKTALKLDVFRPEGAGKRTAVIFLHAGGWKSGHKGWMADAARGLAARGFVTLAVQYRLTSEAPWPAQIQDVKAAICWARANADLLDVEPDRIALYGSSAGGHLALIAAGTPGHATFDPRGGGQTKVAAVVAIHPPTALYMPGDLPPHASPADWLLGKAATITRARTASPISYVSQAFPPTMLLHGGADDVVRPAASQAMYEALSALGAPADLHLYHGFGHGFASLPQVAELIEAEVAMFLDRAVVGHAAKPSGKPAKAGG